MTPLEAFLIQLAAFCFGAIGGWLLGQIIVAGLVRIGWVRP